MRQLSGIISEELRVDDVIDLTGVATRDVTVVAGGALIVTGIISERLTVTPGGLVSIEGAVLGLVTVAWGGHVELLGKALGGIETQGGVVRVAAGSRIGRWRLSLDGHLGGFDDHTRRSGLIPWFTLPRHYDDTSVLTRVD
jgi:hypothetical protein